MKNTCLKLALFVVMGTALVSLFPQKAQAAVTEDSYVSTWTVAATPSAIVTDSTDNIYYAGFVSSPSAVQFNPFYAADPTSQPDGTKIATTGGVFLSEVNGVTYKKTYVWQSDQLNSVSLTKIAADKANNIYVLGTFNGIVNFNPTGGIDSHSSLGKTWSFLLRINADGSYTPGNTYLWQDQNINLRDMTIDASGNIYLLGQAVNNTGGPLTVNLNPLGGLDVQSLSAGDSLGFYTELATGTPNTYGYSRTIKNTASQYLEMDHIASASAGNLFLYGVFAGTMNFNGSDGTDNKTSAGGSNDLFLSKYDAGGNYLSTYTVGGTGSESGGAMAVDGDNNVYYSGGFNGTVNFNPTGNGPDDTQTATALGQIFLTKLNSDGSYGFTVSWQTNELSIHKIAFDSNNLIYLIGASAGPLNYNPIDNSDSQPGFGLNDAFLTVLNPDKTYEYSYVWGGADDDKAVDEAFDSFDNLFITGSTKSLSLNFDPTGATSLITTFAGGENGYVSEFTSNPVISPTPTPDPNAPKGNPPTFGAPVQSFTCTGHVPAAPKIFQIWATQTTATIYFVPSADPQDSYTISYGVYSDAGMYNVTFNYSDKSGAIPYTINALSAATPYYFKVRANNGCMTGEWSNTLNLKTAVSATGGNNAYASDASVNNNSAGAVSSGGSCSQYTVLPGDSFWAIAQKVLGAGNKYLQIWNANKTQFPSLNYSSIIRSGWTLSVGC